MILVTQGHEKSIGLEVFIKSFLLLSTKEQQEFKLYTYKSALNETIESMGLTGTFSDDFVSFGGNKLICRLIKEECDEPQSSTTLKNAISDLNPNKDLLITLPTSKNQLRGEDGNFYKGYTEFLRNKFKNKNISMVFYSNKETLLLITDHIALKDVSQRIDENIISEKIDLFEKNYPKYFGEFDEFIYAGINPHAGENGLLGSEDGVIERAITKIRKNSKTRKHSGPFAGDTLHFYKKNNKQVMTYMYHDQGLSKFKSENGTIGINATIGLPFLRLSVDHGTAFDIYGKNKADYMGMSFLCKTSLKINRKLNVQ